jgi:hypothetical protein
VIPHARIRGKGGAVVGPKQKETPALHLERGRGWHQRVSKSTTIKLLLLMIAAREGWSVSLGYDTGNPRVCFAVPAPIPVNAVPLWYHGVMGFTTGLVGHRGCYVVFAIVVLQMYIIIYNTNKKPPCSRLQRERGGCCL